MIGLIVAALGGAAVGLERQWSGHAEGSSARFAGIRTFTMLGALAGALVREMWGQVGVLSTAAVVGLTDVDALTLSMASGVNHSVSLDTAALAIAIGVLANTILKMTIAFFLGAAKYRMIVGGTLLLMIVAAAAAILLVVR